MIVHEIKTLNTIFNVGFFLYIIYSKIKTLFYGEITKIYHAVSEGLDGGSGIHYSFKL